jgi:hypothetical protein
MASALPAATFHARERAAAAAPSKRGLNVRRFAGDHAAVAGALLLGVALAVGLATAANYGVTIDEFNTNDYGPKALAWYTSGFADRAQFETVEAPLWYYGPWFQMLTAAVQALNLADPLTVRHTMTFLIGLAGLAALLPMARLSFGRWVGPLALAICLLTGYLYGNLFFAPIDVPFLAAMCWGTLAVMVMARRSVPSWPATAGVGLTTGLAIATRTGGIILHAYMVGALALCALEILALKGWSGRKALLGIAIRGLSAIVIAWIVAIALWPWLQIGNPFVQFKTAYTFFAKIPTKFDFVSWGAPVTTTALPWSYIPEQWLARLPIGFLLSLAAAVLLGAGIAISILRRSLARWRRRGIAGLRGPLLLLARSRSMLVVWVAATAPILFLIVEHATLYDGVRHTLFVIPMLALLSGWAIVRLFRSMGRARIPAAALALAYAAGVLANLVMLHPLEYVAMNRIAGGVAGAYGRFDLDYWSAAATEAVRRLEARLDNVAAPQATLPSILVCIPYREQMAEPMLQGKFRLELDPDKADFMIETERARCAADHPDFALVDEVTRAGRAFAWTYVNKRGRFADIISTVAK